MSDTPLISHRIRRVMRQAAEAMERGEFVVARDLAKRVTEGAPAFADGWMMLTEAMAETEQYEEGIAVLETAMEWHPDLLSLQVQRCKFLLGLGRRSECLQQAKALADRAGQDPWSMDMLAMYLSMLEQVDDAAELYERLCKMEPENPDNRVNLGMARLAQGRLEEARACAEEALAISNGFPRALSLLANLGLASEDENHVERLRSALQAPRPLPEQVTLGYALGKELEDLGRWDEAFDAFRKAGMAKRRMEPYDHGQIESLVDAIIEHHDGEFQAGGASGSESDAPIFVFGMPRSGTTLVERILGSHDQVFPAGELRDFMDQVALAVGRSPGTLLEANQVVQTCGLDFRSLGDSYVDAVRPRTGQASRFTDKRPINFMYLGLIAKSLPRAKLIHVSRNPLDVIFSNYKILFGYLNSYSYELESTAKYFVAYHRLMQHWESQLPGRIFTVAYEDLVADPEHGARQLIGHVGLPWQDACRSPHESRATVTTASAVQVRKPIYGSAVGHWRHYEHLLGDAIRVLDHAGIPFR